VIVKIAYSERELIWDWVQGSRFKVQGSRFKVQGSRFKVQSFLALTHFS